MKRLLIVAAMLAGLGPRAGAAPELVNGIVAIVGETVITEKEARQFIEPAIVALERQPGLTRQSYNERAMEIYKDGLNQLIERQLTLNDFKSAGYSFPESIIEDFVQERIRERYGDRVKLIKTLEAQNMTYDQFRTDIRDQFIVEQMNLKNVSSAVVISPFKIATYYAEHPEDFKLPDQVRLRMIELRKRDGGDPEAVRRLARELVAKLAAGTKFAEMASVYSDGSQKREGGDLGWVNRSVLRKEFADATASLKPGQRTGVIEVPDACFILQVEEVKSAQLRPLTEVRDEIEKTLLNQERARLQKKYVERLKKKSFVRFF
ncbi:MAG: peptidylprolyl isomerase [Verrucomicrobia bacterium]|nr:peptidylprolyl isomerase [Verrucomicrobiota bacterium]